MTPPPSARTQRGAIGDHVRECWTKDAGALDIDKERVLLTVTTDATGVAREAKVAGGDVGRMSDPRFRAFAERAVRAIMDPRCANLPLPQQRPWADQRADIPVQSMTPAAMTVRVRCKALMWRFARYAEDRKRWKTTA